MCCISIFFVTVILRCNLLLWYFVCAVVLLSIVLCLFCWVVRTYVPWCVVCRVSCVVCRVRGSLHTITPTSPPLVVIAQYTYIYIIIPILPERPPNEYPNDERTIARTMNERTSDH